MAGWLDGWMAGWSAGGLTEGWLLISRLHTAEGVEGRSGSDSRRVGGAGTGEPPGGDYNVVVEIRTATSRETEGEREKPRSTPYPTVPLDRTSVSRSVRARAIHDELQTTRVSRSVRPEPCSRRIKRARGSDFSAQPRARPIALHFARVNHRAAPRPARCKLGALAARD
jgi:hypothetical protein